MTTAAVSLERPGRLAPKHWVEILCLLIAILVHVPFAPTPLKAWFDSLFEDDDKDELSQDAEVPIELDLDNDKINSKEEVSPPPKPLPTADTAAPSIPDNPPPKPSAEPPKPPPPPPPPPPPVASTSPPDANPGPDGKTPLEAVGVTANPSGNKNNIEIVLVGKVLRTHPVGEKLGALLPKIKQWRAFFEETNVDAVRDVDMIVMMAPQLQKDSSKMDAIIIFGAPMDQVKIAVDKVVDRTKGQWLEGFDSPTALGKADKVERMFVLVPEKSLLYITPPPRPKTGEEWTDEEKLKQEQAKVHKFSAFKSPNVDQPFAINMSIKEPGKLSVVDTGLLGKIQLIPGTIEKVVLTVFPLPNGEASLRIQFYDDTPANALGDVSTIQTNWGLAQIAAHAKLDLVVPDADFQTKGRIISADIKVPQAFLDQVFDLGSKQINKENK